MNVSLFEYPTRHERKHAPAGYLEYQSFKPWLRDEFTFRCVYCLERERWQTNGQSGLSTDHVVAQVKDTARTVDYGNTVYACCRCNSAKRENDLIDPTEESFADHLEVNTDGTVVPKTIQGFKIVHLLHLNKPDPLRVRKQRLRILALKQKYPHDESIDELFLAEFAYPEDLPDLENARPPLGNDLKHNTKNCFYSRRIRKELPEVY